MFEGECEMLQSKSRAEIRAVDALKFLDDYAQLNSDQRQVFKRIVKILCDGDKVLRLYVGGEAGTGKSFLIKTLKYWIEANLKKRVAVAASTWISACKVNGVTVNRLFRIPLRYNDIWPETKYEPLSKDELEIIRGELKDVALFIIDDISMISNRMLAYIHLRLEQIYETDKTDDGYFGKRNVLLLGDLLLCKRTQNAWPFETVTDPHLLQLINKRSSAVQLWDLFEYDELTKNVRHGDDPALCDLLTRIRTGQFNREDANEILHKDEEISPRDTCAVNIFLSPGEVQNFTFEKYKPAFNFSYTLKAKDEIYLSYNSSRSFGIPISYDDYLDLPEAITLNVTAVVLLIRDTKEVAAGSVGRVMKIKYDYELNEVVSIAVAFNNNNNNKISDVFRVTSKYEISKGIFIKREQFPIYLAHGLTVPDTLGLTLNSADVNSSATVELYTVLSRVTSLNGVRLENLDNYYRCSFLKHAVIAEYNRLRKKYRPDLPKLKIPIANYSFPKEMKGLKITKRASSLKITVKKKISFNLKSVSNSSRQDASQNETTMPKFAFDDFIQNILPYKFSSELVKFDTAQQTLPSNKVFSGNAPNSDTAIVGGEQSREKKESEDGNTCDIVVPVSNDAAKKHSLCSASNADIILGSSNAATSKSIATVAPASTSVAAPLETAFNSQFSSFRCLEQASYNVVVSTTITALNSESRCTLPKAPSSAVIPASSAAAVTSSIRTADNSASGAVSNSISGTAGTYVSNAVISSNTAANSTPGTAVTTELVSGFAAKLNLG